MLRKMKFISNENKYIINTSGGYYKPYFQTLKNFELIKTNNFSFISEHMIINSKIMKNLINLIEKKQPENLSWTKTLISNISQDDLYRGGFSEYETYGTYLSQYHPDSFITRKLKYCRHTFSIYGEPNECITYINLLFYRYYWATFENWDKNKQRPIIKVYFKINVYFQ